MASKIVSKLGGANFAPDRLFGRPESEKSMLLGILMGIASGVLIKHDKLKDETHQGYEGNFEFVDADAEREGARSGVLYLPAGLNEMLLDAVKSADGGQVKFVFEVYADRAENARKRAWSFKDLAPAAVDDPMAELRAYLPGASKPAEITQAKGDGASEKSAESGKGSGKL